MGSTARREHELTDRVTDILAQVLNTTLRFPELGLQPSYLIGEALILPSSGLQA